MIDSVGRYTIELVDGAATIVPMSNRCRMKEALHIELEAVNTSYAPIPKYVREYINRKHQYMGIIYLLHFSEPYHHARHYLGFTKNMDKRLLRHNAGSGAKLMKAVTGAGITYEVARIWYGDRYLERTLKKSHNVPRFCPICREED